MDIRIDTDKDTVQIGEVRWTLHGLLGFLESVGNLRTGERIEATRDGDRADFRRVEVQRPVG